MGFCVNLFTVDASFEMGPRGIFLTDGSFVIISRELVSFFDRNTCAWFAMAERERKRERERERERARARETGRGEITSSMKNSLGNSFKFFLKFCHCFSMKCFLE